MKLSITDRFAINVLLPEQGNLLTQILCKSIRGKVILTAREIQEWGVRQENEMLTWNIDKVQEIEIPLEEAEINILKEGVKRLDEKNLITPNNLEICLRIQAYKEGQS
jgi:hypothetical protein